MDPDLKRRKEEGQAIADFLASSTWTAILKPEFARRWNALMAEANDNLDSHPRMAGALRATNELNDLNEWMKRKAQDSQLDLDKESNEGIDISQEEE
jgi:hypothetical protein